MKAVTYAAYGSPEVIQLTEADKPVPKEHEVLIKIATASVTPADIAFRKGEPYITRLFGGFRKPTMIPGTELAGDVEATGKDVTLFQPGDEVFGMAGAKFGAHAEYICVPETAVVAPKPANVTLQEATAICDGGLTSLVFLRDEARLQPGQHVLINGASGSVGIYGVQLAKYFDAEVTGVCSTRNVEFVTSLGADHVIDYTEEDFTQRDAAYDIIFDAVGKSSFSRAKVALKPGGIYLSTVLSMGVIVRMLQTAMTRGKKAKFAATGLKQTQDNLTFLKELTEAGVLAPVMDRVYPLDDIAEAHRYVEIARKRGGVVVTVP